MTLTSPYPLSKGSGTCAATGAAILPGSSYIAALVDAPGTELTRVDYSLDAWNNGDRPVAPARLFGFWKTQYQPTVKEKKQILDDAALLEVFESMGNETAGVGGDAKQIKFRYLLTLLLIRRRQLRVVGHKKLPDGNGNIMHVLRRGEPQAVPMEVIDPGLDDLSVADAMESLAQLVDTDEASDQTSGNTMQPEAKTDVKIEAKA